MMHAKKWIGLVVAWCTVAVWTIWADAQIENVRAQQRARSRVVDVWYDLVSPEGGEFKVSLEIEGGGECLPVSKVSGAVGDRIEPGRNKRIEWDAGADWPGKSGNGFIATVTATRTSEDEGGGGGGGGGSPLVEMVQIPGGTNAGMDPGGKNDGSDAEEYSLSVESFWMDKTEMTYGDWKRVYEWAVGHGYDFDNPGRGKAENHPVHTVNWYDCVKWCNARSEMEERIPAYTVGGAVYRKGQVAPDVDLTGAGYRLPTDEEWEYAARGGGRNQRFPWGDVITHERANYRASSYSYETNAVKGYHPSYNDGTAPYTAPAGAFPANGYGLHEMAGNVSEWTTTASGTLRIVCGGSWSDWAAYCRCIYYSGQALVGADNKRGFRTVRRR